MYSGKLFTNTHVHTEKGADPPWLHWMQKTVSKAKFSFVHSFSKVYSPYESGKNITSLYSVSNTIVFDNLQVRILFFFKLNIPILYGSVNFCKRNS